MLLFMF